MSGILQLGYNYSTNETKAVSVDSNGKMDIDVQVEDLVMKANDGNDGAGTDRTVKCDANGVLEVNASSTALPTGASTLAEQQAQTAKLTTIDTDTSALAGCVGGTELQCDIVSSALPTGAATESTLSALEAHQTDGNQIAQIKANTVKDGSGTSYSPLVDGDGHLQVDVLTGGGGGTQHAAGDAIGTTPTGTLAIGKDGSNNATAIATDNSGHLQVDVLSNALPTGAATEATLATIDADTSALAGCVGGTELQCDIVSSALPTGAATSANQTTVISTIGAGNTLLSTINGKTRTSANTTSSQTSIAVSAGGSATSSTINVSDNGKWAVAVKDNSSGNLHFIIQQSYDGSNWFGEPLAGGGSVVANANQTFEADGLTSTGYWFLTNSEGQAAQGGGGGGGGSLGISQYAQYVRVQAFDTAASATTYDVHWYLSNSA